MEIFANSTVPRDVPRAILYLRNPVTYYVFAPHIW